MKIGTVRDRILSAFKDETTILGRREILEAAKTTDYNEVRHLADAGLLRRDGNEYGITPVGLDKRDRYRDVERLILG